MEPCAARQSKGFLTFLYRFQARPGQAGPGHGSGQSKQTPGFLRPALTPEMDSKIFVAARVVGVAGDGAEVRRQGLRIDPQIIKREGALAPCVSKERTLAVRFAEIRRRPLIPFQPLRRRSISIANSRLANCERST